MAKKCLMLEDHERVGKEVERCFLCNEKIGKSFKQKLQERTALVPKEKKQRFIDLLVAGKTIGEAKREAGIEDLLVAGEIIMQQIGEYHYLKEKVL